MRRHNEPHRCSYLIYRKSEKQGAFCQRQLLRIGFRKCFLLLWQNQNHYVATFIVLVVYQRKHIDVVEFTKGRVVKDNGNCLTSSNLLPTLLILGTFWNFCQSKVEADHRRKP